MANIPGTSDTSLVKQPHIKIEYTPEQIDDLAKCSDPVTGPHYFLSNHVMIQHPVKGAIPLDMYDYQKDLLELYHNYRFTISLLGRQLGKTTIASAYLLWYAMFNPTSVLLVTAHKHKNAAEIIQKIKFAYENCPDHIRCGSTLYNQFSVSFDNGSRIISESTTEKTGRGMSASLIYLDEFAFVPPNIATEFWTALSPTLSEGGKCMITSTPNSDEDTFAMIWKQAINRIDENGNETELGTNGFRPMLVTWDKHPNRDLKWAKEIKAQIGEERFRREHQCEFIIWDETLINPLRLFELKGIDPHIQIGRTRWYKDIDSDKSYVIGLDPSTGTGSDNSAIQVVELPSLIQVGEWYHNKIPIEGQIRMVMEIMVFLESQNVNDIYWSVENNAIGEAALVVIRDTGEETFPGHMLHEPNKVQGKKNRRGFFTTSKSKYESCVQLKRLIEQDKLKINSKPFIYELKNFVAKASSYAAKPNETDDLVTSMLLVVRMIEHISTFEEIVHSAIDSDVLHPEEVAIPSGEDKIVEPMPIMIV